MMMDKKWNYFRYAYCTKDIWSRIEVAEKVFMEKRYCLRVNESGTKEQNKEVLGLKCSTI